MCLSKKEINDQNTSKKIVHTREAKRTRKKGQQEIETDDTDLNSTKIKRTSNNNEEQERNK